MIAVAQCTAYAGLASSEMFLGVVPSAKHRSLLASYLFNSKRGADAVRDMILADLRASIDLGAKQRAADLLLVLRLFLSGCPEARSGGAAAPIALSGNALGGQRFSFCCESEALGA